MCLLSSTNIFLIVRRKTAFLEQICELIEELSADQLKPQDESMQDVNSTLPKERIDFIEQCNRLPYSNYRTLLLASDNSA